MANRFDNSQLDPVVRRMRDEDVIRLAHFIKAEGLKNWKRVLREAWLAGKYNEAWIENLRHAPSFGVLGLSQVTGEGILYRYDEIAMEIAQRARRELILEAAQRMGKLSIVHVGRG